MVAAETERSSRVAADHRPDGGVVPSEGTYFTCDTRYARSHCMCSGDSCGVPYSVRKSPGIPRKVESPYPPMIVRDRLICLRSSGRYTIASFWVTELRYGRRCPRASRELKSAPSRITLTATHAES
ncbi:hypothetical protein K466DRAFT_212858 [Polyporus arcularius HHB13444]|uniref:Uncharacterized protein n=1 Tax=Polyporus arcularius HHB13444 TaxID=1314778 RepID=A0A5C3P5R4_9APHY|nr:hypothetical protein K466DRAFT_212858 [Polyporus arcularius HHB13444]